MGLPFIVRWSASFSTASPIFIRQKSQIGPQLVIARQQCPHQANTHNPVAAITVKCISQLVNIEYIVRSTGVEVNND